MQTIRIALLLDPHVVFARRAMMSWARQLLRSMVVISVLSAIVSIACACGEVSLVGGQDAGLTADASVADAGGGDARIVIDAVLPPADAMVGPADANANTIVLTHSNSEIVQDGRAFFCGDEENPPHHVSNSYFRVFDLNEFDIAGELAISSVRFGVELSQAEDGATEQDANLFFYTLPRGVQFRYRNLELLGNVEFSVPNQQLEVFDVAVAVAVPAGSQLVVELAIPTGEVAKRFFYVGFNSFGQTAPSYLVAPTCGDSEPTDLADLDGGDAHFILSVQGVDLGGETGE